MKWHKIKSHFELVHLYTAGALAIAIAAIALITGLAAHHQNRQSLATQQMIAEFDSQDAFDYLKGQTRQMVYWQDAFDHIARKWDQAWVAYQFGPYQDTMGNHLVALVGPDRNIRFLHGSEFDRNFTSKNLAHTKGLDALLNALRNAGLKQPPPIPQGVIVAGGKPYYAVAAYITPESNGDLVYARAHPYVAIFLKPVTVSQYSGFASGFEAENVRITSEDHTLPGEVRYALTDAAGRPVAFVQWKPRLPGDHFLQSITIPLIGVFLLLTLIQVLISQRWMRLQQRLIRAEAESSAVREQSRLKSVFLGTISHELRTPLNAIIGYADVLCANLFGPLGSPRNLEYVRDIRESGNQLLSAVNDLIEIARIEAHDTGVDEGVFEAGPAIGQAIASRSPAAQAKSISISMTAQSEGAWCKGSSISLTQALERVLDNAIRHSPSGSTIDVSLKTERDTVVIETVDHGEGIPPERLADLSQPFLYSGNHLVARGTKAMGFGIPIARGLISLMGGTLEIESELERGTTVRFRLPAEAAKGAPPGDDAGIAADSGVIWTGRGRDYIARRKAWR